MDSSVKSKIYAMLENINDEHVLNQVMEDVSFYADKKDIVDMLDAGQIEELDLAIKEADNNDTIDWESFKKEMAEWRKK